jgi:hypothetical protein
MWLAKPSDFFLRKYPKLQIVFQSLEKYFQSLLSQKLGNLNYAKFSLFDAAVPV